MNDAMQISLSEITKASAYKLMNAMIVPRPIAWVTTRSREGLVNLAPFSTFNIVCYDPPLVGLSIAKRSDGKRKDTARNAIDTNEMVVHIADVRLLEMLHASSAEFPTDTSEPKELGLALLPSSDVAVPRLEDAPLALECVLHQVLEFSTTSEFVVARILRVHARDGLIENFKIDTQALGPLARLGGPVYGAIGEVFVRHPPVFGA